MLDETNENLENEDESYNDVDIFEEAQERLTFAKNNFSTIYQHFVEDIRFGLLGEQWEAKTMSDRKSENRTIGVYNKIAPLVRNIVNTSLKNSPAIKVSPRTSKDKNLQKIYEGLVKHIQNESNADQIWNETLKNSVAGGIGVFEIVVEDDFDGLKKIKISRITDPTSVYPDPSAKQPDLSDAKWLFHLNVISKKEFEKLYPGKDSSEIENKNKDWFAEGSVTIAEYWKIEDDGSVCWYVLNGNEVIDSSKWKTDAEGNPLPYPGKYIPYCFVLGEEIWVDGERFIKSAVTDIRDYQKTYNYMQSEAIDYVAKTAKTPYIVSDAAIGPYKDLWADANTKNTPFLPYVDGKSVPQRNDPPAPPVGYIDSITRIDADIRTTIGVRDPLQDIPASQSGKAIQLQLAQSNVNTYVWTDHLNRAIKQAGRIIVDLIPHYYNYPHIQQIIGIDGQVDSMPIQQPFQVDGEYKIIDLASDKYAVTISTGASYQDSRKETFESLLEMARINPQIFQVAGDIILRQMDFAESNEVADRFAALLPPAVAQVAGQSNSEFALKQQLMQTNAKLQQAMQTLEQLTNITKQKDGQLQALASKLQDKSDAAQIKAQTDLQKQAMENMVKREQTEIESRTKIAEAQIDSEKELQIKQLEMMIEQIKNTQTVVHVNPGF